MTLTLKFDLLLFKNFNLGYNNEEPHKKTVVSINFSRFVFFAQGTPEALYFTAPKLLNPLFEVRGSPTRKRWFITHSCMLSRVVRSDWLDISGPLAHILRELWLFLSWKTLNAIFAHFIFWHLPSFSCGTPYIS